MENNKKNALRWLEDNGIAYEMLEHEAVYNMEDMDKAGITAKGDVCKNLFLRDQKGKKHYLVVCPEEAKVDLADLSTQLMSTKLSFASAERLEVSKCGAGLCISSWRYQRCQPRGRRSL